MELVVAFDGHYSLVLYNSISSQDQLEAAIKRPGRTVMSSKSKPKLVLPEPEKGTSATVDMEHLTEQLRVHVCGVTGVTMDEEGGAIQLQLDDPEQQAQGIQSLISTTLVQVAAAESQHGSKDSVWFRQAVGVPAGDVLASRSYLTNPLHILILLALLVRSPVRVMLPTTDCSNIGPKRRNGHVQSSRQSLLVVPPSAPGLHEGVAVQPTCSGGSCSMEPSCSFSSDTQDTSQHEASESGHDRRSDHVVTVVQVELPEYDVSFVKAEQLDVPEQVLERMQPFAHQLAACVTMQGPHPYACHNKPPAQVLVLKLGLHDSKWRIDVVAFVSCMRKLRRRSGRAMVVQPVLDACCCCSHRQPPRRKASEMCRCSGAFCAFALCGDCAKEQYLRMTPSERDVGVALWGWLCGTCMQRGRHVHNAAYLKPQP